MSLGYGAVQAQGPALEGRIVSSEGAPLADVQVHLVGARRGTISDSMGSFLIHAPPSPPFELRFSLIGHAPERVVVRDAGSSPLRIVLRETPLSLPGLQVTATPGQRDPLSVTQATSELGARELQREMGSTLAQTLRAQPGIAVRSMGPAATMPVLRGLTGDRVLVLQDGQRSADLAGSADDHGVTIDPLAAQRVEVVRGPATLLYGNNAVGGVVNVISGDIPTARLNQVEGVLSAHSETAFPGAAASARVAVPIGSSWTLTGRASGRTTGAMVIPTEARLGRRLANTEATNSGGALGLGRISEAGNGGLALRGYRFEYGLPVPPGAEAVELRGERLELGGRVEVTQLPLGLGSLRLDGTAQEYGHDELSGVDEELLQRFDLSTRTANLLIRRQPAGRSLDGAWGASLLTRSYAAVGQQALTPPADSRGVGVFGFQEVELIRGGAALQIGGRFDVYHIESAASERFGPAVERSFRSLSGAAGVRLPVSSFAAFSVHVGRSFRAPTVEELFSNAAHAGTGAVELGNPRLAAERGLSVESLLRIHGARLHVQLALFRNTIDDFVHLTARGDTVLYGVRLPVLAYTQERATLSGAEASVEWAATERLVLGLLGDYLHAAREGGEPLSYMPPPRLGTSVRWEGKTFSAGGDVHHELAQRRVGEAGEPPTPAHTILRLHAGVTFRSGGHVHTITLRGENLGDEVHREATSRIKEFAPGPGRNLSIGYRLFY